MGILYCAIKHSKISIEIKKFSSRSHHHPWAHGWLESRGTMKIHWDSVACMRAPKPLMAPLIT
jgi:hypothetical protein